MENRTQWLNNITSQVKKIAFLLDTEFENDIRIQEFQTLAHKKNIDVKVFFSNEAILDYQPDFILSMTPEHAKLTPFPTYGLINLPRDAYLELPRYLRNVLTYDGYLTTSSRLKLMLQDVMFGTRKLNTNILHFDFYPCFSDFTAPNLHNEFVIFEPYLANSRNTQAIDLLLNRFPSAKLLTFTPNTKYQDRTIHVHDVNHLRQVMHNAGITLCLQSGDRQEQILYPEVLQAIAASSVAICHRFSELENVFADNIFYISADTPLTVLADEVNLIIKKILHQPNIAIEKAKHAHQEFILKFALDNYLEQLLEFHARTLIAKGYKPNPNQDIETKLPSVTYIMRTGGKHRPFLERALNCLVAQNYPDLRVIFVIHARFDYIHEIIAQYPSLKIKVIESIKSQRSKAICDGMAAVETELFGLFDDDDELFPNHVRSLVTTLQYNSNRDWRGEIGMVYSGSIHADDTYPVEERVEYRDYKLKNRFEKRAIEHFKFYSSTLMSRHAWFMPNGWLARRKLIDVELLTDPQLDTCEDLYFELQIAQKAHFAFSMEVTAIHNFHHLGNSTIDDSHKHLPDTQRIALRNLGRVFPPDAQYDTHYSIVGRLSAYDPNQIAYQDRQKSNTNPEYYEVHPFFPLRTEIKHRNYNDPAELAYAKINLLRIPTLPLKFIKYFFRFIKMPHSKKVFYYKKFKSKADQFGFFPAIYLTLFKLQNKPIMRNEAPSASLGSSNLMRKRKLRERYYQFRIAAKYKGLGHAIKVFFYASTENQ